eukprot:TRINITY_DN22729_c0_g1_i3.p1 TRINITY_DN22729_c0_g1~~TRINITY_DN22729_c0_g1_i3.p1  ORF type:complete len:386 (+),score=34.14 TRINITY_DN22729_c0_g1_i3:81-1238(+)
MPPKCPGSLPVPPGPRSPSPQPPVPSTPGGADLPAVGSPLKWCTVSRPRGGSTPGPLVRKQQPQALAASGGALKRPVVGGCSPHRSAPQAAERSAAPQSPPRQPAHCKQQQQLPREEESSARGARSSPQRSTRPPSPRAARRALGRMAGLQTPAPHVAGERLAGTRSSPARPASEAAGPADGAADPSGGAEASPHMASPRSAPPATSAAQLATVRRRLRAFKARFSADHGREPTPADLAADRGVAQDRGLLDALLRLADADSPGTPLGSSCREPEAAGQPAPLPPAAGRPPGARAAGHRAESPRLSPPRRSLAAPAAQGHWCAEGGQQHSATAAASGRAPRAARRSRWSPARCSGPPPAPMWRELFSPVPGAAASRGTTGAGGLE